MRHILRASWRWSNSHFDTSNFKFLSYDRCNISITKSLIKCPPIKLCLHRQHVATLIMYIVYSGIWHICMFWNNPHTREIKYEWMKGRHEPCCNVLCELKLVNDTCICYVSVYLSLFLLLISKLQNFITERETLLCLNVVFFCPSPKEKTVYVLIWTLVKYWTRMRFHRIAHINLNKLK